METALKEWKYIDQKNIAHLQDIFKPQRQTENNGHIQDLQDKLGITKLKDKADIPNTFVDMQSLKNEDWAPYFHFVNVSESRVEPVFAQVLQSISIRFNEKAQELGYSWGWIMPTITSLTRPETANGKLGNSSKNSAHLYGIGADFRIINDRFLTWDQHPDNTQQEDVLMNLFVEVLQEFEEKEIIFAMTEKAPSPHIHINLARGYENIKEFSNLSDTPNIANDNTNIVVDTTKSVANAVANIFKSEESQDTKNTINDTMTQQIYEFSSYLESADISSYNRNTPLWKWLRTMRSYESVDKILQRNNSPLSVEAILALIMQESHGDPLSVNSYDGGIGILHTQPDTAKEWGLKIFTDEKQYKIFTVTKNNRRQMFKTHGTILMEKKKEYANNMDKLEQFDERFNKTKLLDASIKHLNNIYNKAKKFDYTKKQNEHKNNQKIAQENNINIFELYAFNGFNKWAGSFMRDFQWSNNTAGNHMKNTLTNLTNLRKYDKAMKDGIKKGLSEQSLLEYITTNN